VASEFAQLIFPTHNITIVSNNLINFLTSEVSILLYYEDFAGNIIELYSNGFPQALLNKGQS